MQDDHDVPVADRLPGDIYFRHLEAEARSWDRHSHPWGQFNYLSRGVMDLEVTGQRFLSPPHYAIWIPPDREHASRNAGSIIYRSAYLSRERSERMPAEPCALGISAVLKAILDEFARLGVRSPNTPEQARMAQVALDQIEAAVPVAGYLPYASSTELQRVLDAARASMGEMRSTEQFAHAFNLTTRMLERRCRAELGMGFGEWRKRLRFVAALDGLDAGRTIQQVAHDLGYGSPSAFISMFHRLCGQTPQKYRRSSPTGSEDRDRSSE